MLIRSQSSSMIHKRTDRINQRERHNLKWKTQVVSNKMLFQTTQQTLWIKDKPENDTKRKVKIKKISRYTKCNRPTHIPLPTTPNQAVFSLSCVRHTHQPKKKNIRAQTETQSGDPITRFSLMSDRKSHHAVSLCPHTHTEHVPWYNSCQKFVYKLD